MPHSNDQKGKKSYCVASWDLIESSCCLFLSFKSWTSLSWRNDLKIEFFFSAANFVGMIRSEKTHLLENDSTLKENPFHNKTSSTFSAIGCSPRHTKPCSIWSKLPKLFLKICLWRTILLSSQCRKNFKPLENECLKSIFQFFCCPLLTSACQPG